MSAFEKYTIETSNYIMSDISEPYNPIKYHNKFYNKCWNRSNKPLEQLLDTQINNLNKIIKNIPSLSDPKIYDLPIESVFDLSENSYPLIYKLYKSDNPNITYEQFNNYYNLRKIKISAYNDILNKIYQKIEPEDIREQLLRFQNGQFISLDVKLYVEKNINRCFKYEFDHMDFYFFHNKLLDKETITDIVKNIYIISLWIYHLNPQSKIILSYFDTEIKKLINPLNPTNQNSASHDQTTTVDNEFRFLSSQNINSGSSASGYQLMLWRREELYKVLIHELIHYNDIDVKHDHMFDNIIKGNIGKIPYPVLINETITEIQAQFLHTLYLSMQIISKRTKPHNLVKIDQVQINQVQINQTQIIDTFKTLYNYEQIFSWYQFSKIMNYYSIEKFRSSELRNKFNQSTNAFSYYILKSILTINFDQIILKFNHFETNHPNQNIQNQNIPTPCNVNHCPIIKNHINHIWSKPPKKFINKIIRFLQLDDSSLRMTLFG